MKPYVWFDGRVWFVSPRGQHGVRYGKAYPQTRERGYSTLVEAADEARLAVSEPS